jgi:hypothetical protein
MKSIAFRPNFEVCNTEGDNFFADVFIEQVDNPNSPVGSLRFYAFKVDEYNEHDEDFYDAEMQAWLEDATFFEVHEPTGDDELTLRVGHAIGAVSDVLRGVLGPILVPSIPYMENDENQMTDRDRLEAELFFAAMYTRCKESVSVEMKKG